MLGSASEPALKKAGSANRSENLPGYGGFVSREDVMTNETNGRIKTKFQAPVLPGGRILPGYTGYRPGDRFKVSGEIPRAGDRKSRSGGGGERRSPKTPMDPRMAKSDEGVWTERGVPDFKVMRSGGSSRGGSSQASSTRTPNRTRPRGDFVAETPEKSAGQEERAGRSGGRNGSDAYPPHFKPTPMRRRNTMELIPDDRHARTHSPTRQHHGLCICEICTCGRPHHCPVHQARSTGPKTTTSTRQKIPFTSTTSAKDTFRVYSAEEQANSRVRQVETYRRESPDAPWSSSKQAPFDAFTTSQLDFQSPPREALTPQQKEPAYGNKNAPKERRNLKFEGTPMSRMVHRPFDPDEIRSSKVKGVETGRKESTEAPWHDSQLKDAPLQKESVMAASFKPPPREPKDKGAQGWATPAESKAPRKNIPFEGVSEYKNKYKEWEMSQREQGKPASAFRASAGPSPMDHQQERLMITTSQADYLSPDQLYGKCRYLELVDQHPHPQQPPVPPSGREHIYFDDVSKAWY